MSVFEEIARREGPLALATVIETRGSAPAQQAMKMLVDAGGRLAGSVGGGRVEAAVIESARARAGGAAPEILEFTLDDADADEGGMICGGTVRILVEGVEGGAAWAHEAAELVRTGRRGAVVAEIGTSVTRRCLHGADATPHIGTGEPHLEGATFVEPLIRPRCLIIGAGHVGRAVARVARLADFAVAIAEDREEQAARADADEVVCAPLLDAIGSLEPCADDFIVIMTRGHGLDRDCARAALATPARYVGMLASRRKAATIREALGDAAERLHAPIGLDLGAHSAGEIAVSVVAQMIKVRRTGRGDR